LDLGHSHTDLIRENAFLRQQLIILNRQIKRPHLTNPDRFRLVLLSRFTKFWKQTLHIVQPDTLLRWHREMFRLYWRQKSQGQPKISSETIALIQKIAKENHLWGAERIRGELLKLGIRVSKQSIQKYMPKERRSRSSNQTWATFYSNRNLLRMFTMTLEMIPLPENSPLAIAGRAANREAARSSFIEYRSRKAMNTLRRQDADLALFTEYLQSAGTPAADFANDPNSWRGITWGLVEGFVKWQLMNGYAVDSVNVRLSTVKQYAQLALKAGTLEVSEYAMIRTVKGYSHKETKRIDEKRRADGLDTRKGTKKAHAVAITDEQAKHLMQSDGTAKGKRDALLMCLMLDHGLRVGEVATLQVSDFDLTGGCMTFYRQKVDKMQMHRLTDRALQAARAYMKIAPKEGSLWRQGDRKGTNKLKKQQGLTERGINKRVELVGRRIGIEKLSPHDLRHYWGRSFGRLVNAS
jgi:integrase